MHIVSEGEKMSDEIEEVSVEDALQMESIFSQALMDVMVAKRLITEQEVLDRIEEIKKEIDFV